MFRECDCLRSLFSPSLIPEKNQTTNASDSERASLPFVLRGGKYAQNALPDSLLEIQPGGLACDVVKNRNREEIQPERS